MLECCIISCWDEMIINPCTRFPFTALIVTLLTIPLCFQPKIYWKYLHSQMVQYFHYCSHHEFDISVRNKESFSAWVFRAIQKHEKFGLLCCYLPTQNSARCFSVSSCFCSDHWNKTCSSSSAVALLLVASGLKNYLWESKIFIFSPILQAHFPDAHSTLITT